MVAWVWVAVAALAVVALQAFLFHRARRNWGVDGEGGHRQRGLAESGRGGEHSTEAAGVRCPHCGQVNGESFTFCRRCVQRVQ